jgi:hypothetical protein
MIGMWLGVDVRAEMIKTCLHMILLVFKIC